MKKLKITEKYPHKILLPKKSKSPSNSVYGKFDIVKQTKALSTFSNNPTTIRCQEPFTISVLVGKKIRIIESKLGK